MVMEMINPLDHASFAQQEMGLNVMFSIHSEPSQYGRVGMVPGIKYPSEERRCPGMSIGGSGCFCLLLSFFFSSLRGLANPVSFCLGGRDAL